MKKSIALILTCALLLSMAVPAMAASLNPWATMALKDGGETVYIGEENSIFNSGSPMELLEAQAKDLVYADATQLIYTAVDEQNQHEYPAACMLYSLPLNVGEADPIFIDSSVTDSVFIARDSLAYYVPEEDQTTLRGYNPLQGAYSDLIKADGAITALTASIEGVLVSTEAGTKLYVPQVGQLMDAPFDPIGMTTQVYDSFETLLDAQGNLSLRAVGADMQQIDTNVIAAIAQRGMVYYLKHVDSDVLMSYDYSAKSTVTIGSFKSQMLPELAATNDSVFLISADQRIFQMGLDSHSVSQFNRLNEGCSSPVLVGAGDMLLVYDAASTSGALTYFAEYSFAVEAEVQNIEPEEQEPEATPAPTAEPEPTEEPVTILVKGSRGDEVLTLQNLLHKHGYPVGKSDGIYGSGTVNAVKYLQYDMGVKETGTVTIKFLEELQHKGLPTYHQYVQMSKGDKGIRVHVLQQRLHSLGYLTGSVDGDYGSATVAAVKLFEKAMSDKENGVATTKVQEQLFKKNAVKAWDAFSDVEKPAAQKKPTTTEHKKHKQYSEVDEDSLINMVRWMNNHFSGGSYYKKHAIYKLQSRLYELGYLKKSQRTKVYDANTFKAMKGVQMNNDILPHPSGLPDKKTLEWLFG
ncbi:peptidoglycan-binding protein [Eubacteriales bacterium OttesenSCG-928-N13]|nr:peptidoglycan-binding protein [Eubacteriales bacterium OttesenSCG-928-N13]